MKITINTQPKADEEDIFKAGTLVKSDFQLILVTTGEPYKEGLFCGVVIESVHYAVGRYDNDWVKDGFVKFIGNVLLEQGV